MHKLMRNFKNFYFISAILLLFISPLVHFYSPSYPWSEHLLWSSIYKFVNYYTMAEWFFLFGLSIGSRYKKKIGKLAKCGLALIGVLLFANHHSMDLIPEKSDWWFMLPFVLRYWAGQILYHSVFMIVGIIIYGTKIKISERQALLGWIMSAALVLCLYYIHNFVRGESLFTIYYPLAIFPFIISLISLYKWSTSLNIENKFLSSISPRLLWFYVIVIGYLYLIVNELGAVIITLGYWGICYLIYRWKQRCNIQKIQ